MNTSHHRTQHPRHPTRSNSNRRTQKPRDAAFNALWILMGAAAGAVIGWAMARPGIDFWINSVIMVPAILAYRRWQRGYAAQAIAIVFVTVLVAVCSYILWSGHLG